MENRNVQLSTNLSLSLSIYWVYECIITSIVWPDSLSLSLNLKWLWYWPNWTLEKRTKKSNFKSLNSQRVSYNKKKWEWKPNLKNFKNHVVTVTVTLSIIWLQWEIAKLLLVRRKKSPLNIIYIYMSVVCDLYDGWPSTKLIHFVNCFI